MNYLYHDDEHMMLRHWLWLMVLAGIYAVYTALQWSQGYIDFGDGNYMYIGWRIAQGVTPYRDILAPQPPCHLFMGAAIVRLAAALKTEPLFLFRAFSLLLHLASFGLIAALAWRGWRHPASAVLAGAIYLWLPIGYWWSLGYQSEPLEIFLLLCMVLLALRGSWWTDLLAGLFAAAAALTNATAAPFELVLIIFMLVRAPWRAIRMAVAALAAAGAVTAWLQWGTSGAFLQNVVFNQVGTFYGFAYALNKLNREGSGILFREGIFLALALVGVWRLLRESPLPPIPRGGLAWFCLATLCSIFYVTKGGTEDYIFSLAEPAIAILAAGELTAMARRGWTTVPDPDTGWVAPSVPFKAAKLVALGLLAFFSIAPGLDLYHRIWNQLPPYELPEPAALELSRLLKRYAGPGEPVLAPPYYAFLAKRPIAGDYSELFIWSNKDNQDRIAAYDRLAAQGQMGLKSNIPDGQKLYLVERMGLKPEGEGWLKTVSLAGMIERKELPIVILEMDQTGKKPEIMRALERNYEPLPVSVDNAINRHVPYSKLRDVMLAATNNTRLGLFIPLRSDAPEAVAEQRQLWQQFKDDLGRVYGKEEVHYNFGLWYDEPLAGMETGGGNPPSRVPGAPTVTPPGAMPTPEPRTGATTATTSPQPTPTPTASPMPSPTAAPLAESTTATTAATVATTATTPTSPVVKIEPSPKPALPPEPSPTPAPKDQTATNTTPTNEASVKSSTEPLKVVRLQSPGVHRRKHSSEITDADLHGGY